MTMHLMSDAVRTAEMPIGALRSAFAASFSEWLSRQGALLGVKRIDSGRYVHVNAALASMLGRRPEDVVGRTDAELFDPGLATALRAADHTALAHGSTLASEHRFDWAGRRHEYLVTRIPFGPDAEGQHVLSCVWVDQAPQRQRELQLKAALEQLEQQHHANDALRRELKDQGLRDAETGLYAKSHFEDQLRREVDLSNREHREFALVLIHIDAWNESATAMGAAARTRIYETMGRLLRGNTRAMDASCRLDENLFGVLLSGVGLATAHSRMEGLRRQCASQIVVLDGRELGFSVSMGVASYPHTARTQEDLLHACRSALSEAQRRGGNHLTMAGIRFDAGGP